MAATKFSNQYRRSRNAFGAGRGGPLDNEQKARVCILAREAYDKLDTYLPLTDWRQMEQQNAVGKDSLRDCTQSDYLRLVAHFQHLAGDDRRATKTILKDALSEKRTAMNKLEESCAERGIKLSYPEKICAKQFKCPLDQATARQLWCLVFTVRNRKKKAAPEKMECPF